MNEFKPEETDFFLSKGWVVKKVKGKIDAEAIVKASGELVSHREGFSYLEVEKTFEIEILKGELGYTPIFQALHFDDNHPICVSEPTDIHLAVGVYCLPACIKKPTASTCLVRLDKLGKARSWPNPKEVSSRLKSYGESHGSWLNWDGGKDYMERTLSRLIDAIDLTNELTPYRQIPRGLWWNRSHGGNEFQTEKEETTFFSRHGVEIESSEEEVILKPENY